MYIYMDNMKYMTWGFPRFFFQKPDRLNRSGSDRLIKIKTFLSIIYQLNDFY